MSAVIHLAEIFDMPVVSVPSLALVQPAIHRSVLKDTRCQRRGGAGIFRDS